MKSKLVCFESDSQSIDNVRKEKWANSFGSTNKWASIKEIFDSLTFWNGSVCSVQ